jgi:hypothetical protein
MAKKVKISQVDGLKNELDNRIPYTGANQNVNLGNNDLIAGSVSVRGSSSYRNTSYAIYMGNNKFLTIKFTSKIYDQNIRFAASLKGIENTTGINPISIDISFRAVYNSLRAIVSDSNLSNIVYYEDDDFGYLTFELRNSYAYINLGCINSSYVSEVFYGNALNLDDKTNIVNATVETDATREWANSNLVNAGEYSNYRSTYFERINLVNDLVSTSSSTGNFKKLTNVASNSVGNNSGVNCDIIITLPITTSTNWIADINIFTTAYSCKLRILGYSISNSSNRVAFIQPNDDILSVKFGRIGDTTVLIIKRANPVLNRLQVSITDFWYHHSNSVTLYDDKSRYKVEFKLEEELVGFTLNNTINNSSFVRDSYYLNYNNLSGKPELTLYALLSQVYTQAQALELFVKKSGAEDIAGTKTFTESPIVPAGTLNGHAVNLAQLNALVRTWHEVINAGSGSDAVTNRGVTITNTSTTNNQDIFSVFHYPNESYDRFFRIQNVAGRLSFYTSQNQENGTGVDIAFFGYYALHALKRDVLNTAIAFNSAFGTNALRELEQGVGNTAFGNNAGRYVRLGDNNTFVGRSAGYSLNLNRLTGSNNTFIGALAGNGVGSDSSGNTIIGVNPSVSTKIDNEVLICFGNGQIAFRKYNDGRVVLPTQTKETFASDTTGKAVVTKEILNSYIDVTLDHTALVDMATNGLTVTQASFGINTSTHFVRIVPYKCEGTFISPEENAILRSVNLMKDNNKIVGWSWMNSEKWNSRRVSNDFGIAQIGSENPSGYEVTGNFKIGCHSYVGGNPATTFKMRIYYEIAEL